MEAELNRLDIPLVFTRPLHEALFAANAFTFYNEVSPYNALFGRQPAMLPDLPVLDHDQPTETSDHSREQTIRRVCIEAITQATAVANTNRAFRTKTTITGQHYYGEGNLVDYHRLRLRKMTGKAGTAHFPVVRNDPEIGQVIIRVDSRDVQVQYGDARHSLYIEALIAREIGSDNTALRTAFTFVASLSAGRPALSDIWLCADQERYA
eukprot:6621365-Pyramimonas_sp.AAC.1